ncbi:hypothetical protein ACFV4P_09240 [Kitasatospora sp. NPDC059795]|uniref:hypothetical protein n=1 Tax=Kitasatospora sp. NPDC059795 TaxID=3346949 RepID=UPI003656AE71
MAGTVVVRAEQSGIGRAGTFTVLVDGEPVGRVRQGDVARFPAAAGTREVRVTSKDRTRSNALTVQVGEDSDTSITARSTGLGYALFLPVVAGFTVPPIYAVTTVFLLGAVFYLAPGLMFRLRADPEPLAALPAPAGAAEEGGGSGLWWESDPALAKRFRKDADA